MRKLYKIKKQLQLKKNKIKKNALEKATKKLAILVVSFLQFKILVTCDPKETGPHDMYLD